MNGTKILSIQALDLQFLDSYNYLPFAVGFVHLRMDFREDGLEGSIEGPLIEVPERLSPRRCCGGAGTGGH